ncbi:MAG: hypothetical protein Q9217_003423 [Psora testacea]
MPLTSVRCYRSTSENLTLAGRFPSSYSKPLPPFAALRSPAQTPGFVSRPFFRLFASLDTAHIAQSINSTRFKSSSSIKVDALIRSPNRACADAWTDLLESYLPKRLRRTYDEDQQTEEAAEYVHDIATLPSLLAKARAFAKADILSHLVGHQGRWEAVIWLVEAMLDKCHNYQQEDEPSQELPVPLWSARGWSLSELTLNAFDVELPQPSHLPLDHLLAWDTNQGEENASLVGRQSLGVIWQSLGSMILLAEDRSAEDPSYQAIMSLVLDILSQMHHISALPPKIYNYAPANDKSVVQRPPTLYVLSARIMTVLSDVAWKKHWISEMAKAKEYGYELPPARVQPQLPHVGTEVWLELILWACVEGGWITEAAWIISDMESRKSDKNRQWSVISWDDICQTKAPKLDWTTILKLQIDKARLNQSTGIGIANSGTSSVDMGPRTVSREVILAILDGITNRASTKVEMYGERVTEVLQHVKNCKNLLERHHMSLSWGHMNAVMLRIIESAVLKNQSSSGALSRIIDTNPIIRSAREFNVQPDDQISETGMDLSAAILGLLHRILYNYSDWGNFQGSLQTLRDIQNIIDANRDVYIHEFANELRERLQQGREDPGLLENLQKRTSPLLYPQIPVYTLARLLDFVAENKFTELGQWLIHNDDIDGGVILDHMYDDPNLQPALLRFATATADNELLTRVLERLQPPLSGTTLRALLRCQVVLNKWDAVENILRHFRSTAGLNWSPSDVMAIAAGILKMLRSMHHSNHVGRALGILKDILQGRYDPPQSASQLYDPSHIQRANQLIRILRSIPGKPFENIPSDPAREAGRFSKAMEISARAFNIILEAVVEQHGCAAGRALWQRWCLAPDESTPRTNIFSINIEDRDEKVVTPAVYMLRTIVRPVAQKIRKGRAESPPPDLNTTEQDGSNTQAHARGLPISDEDRSLINWAVPLYQKFGIANKAINGELPGAIKVIRESKAS